MNFSTSDKLVCVNDGPDYRGDPVPLKQGTVYVVRGLDHTNCDGTGLLLVGVTAGLWRDGTELSFDPNRFRHLRTLQAEAGVERKLAEFAELLRRLE